MQHETRRPAEALDSYRRARSIRERLVSENATVTVFRSDLAESHDGIGGLQRETGKTAEAIESYEQALAIRKRLAHEHPELPEFASDMGKTLNNMALIDLDQRQFDKARGKLMQAIEWQRKALAVHPKHPKYRRFLALHLTNLIRANEALGLADLADLARRELAELAASDPAKVALDARLAAVLAKTETPKDNAERVRLAYRAYQKALHVSSARLFAEALANDPKLADDRRAQHAYNAACAAAGRLWPGQG